MSTIFSMSTTDQQNPFGKLEEALRVYLNPTLELINQNIDLSQHCYYKLRKYPSGQDTFWEQLSSIQHKQPVQLTELISWIEQHQTEKQYPEKDKLLSNLRLAETKNDQDYLKFILSQRPKNKKTLSLVRKQAMIEPDLATQLGIIDPSELNQLTIGKLKMLIHQYIAKQQLQEEDQVKLDSVLEKLLFSPSMKEQPSEVHYFQLLKLFNSRYR